jgi:hypothetical protein
MEKAFWTMSEVKFETVDDWNNLKKDEEKRADWGLVMDYLDGVGVFVGEGLIDIRLVAKLMGGSSVNVWERIEKGVYAMRKEYNFPRIAYDTEYLYNRLKEYEREHPEMLFVSPSPDTFRSKDASPQ